MTGLPPWIEEATAAGLAERRALLLPGQARRAALAADLTGPTGAEVADLVDAFAPVGAGAPVDPRTPAQALRDQHVRRTRRGRRWAIAFAVAVLGLSLAGPLSRQSQALEPGQRTTLELRTLRTTGAGVVVAGRGELTLEDRDGQPVLVLHEGSVEVAAAGDEAVTVEVGPHTVSLAGGRLRLERVGGEVRIRAEEGLVRVDGPSGAATLRPGEAPWAPPPPEESETCGGEPEGEGPEAVADRPMGAAEGAPAASAEPAGGGRAAVALRLGAPPSELGLAGTLTLAELEADHAARAAAAGVGAANPAGGAPAHTRASLPVMPLVGGPQRAMGAPSGGGGAPALAGAPPGDRAVAVGTAAGVGAALAAPAVTAAVAHGVEGPGAPFAAHHDSGLGVCLIPAAPEPPSVPLGVARPAPPTAPEAAPRPPPAARVQAPAPTPTPAAPARTLPLPPGLGAPEAAPAAPPAAQAATRRAIDQVLFGAGVEVLECEP